MVLNYDYVDLSIESMRSQGFCNTVKSSYPASTSQGEHAARYGNDMYCAHGSCVICGNSVR